jgi:hypothetical protein
MEYQQNLTGHFKKSKFRISIAILSILLPLALILQRIFTKQNILIWNWIWAAFFFIYGVYHIAGGMGYLLENFFGRKSFVHIDDDKFRIKTIGKEHVIFWPETESIEFRNGYLRFSLRKETLLLIQLSVLDDISKELFWEAHLVGKDKEYYHMEQLVNLGALPYSGFKIAAFQLKIVGASAAPARVVAVME